MNRLIIKLMNISFIDSNEKPVYMYKKTGIHDAADLTLKI